METKDVKKVFGKNLLTLIGDCSVQKFSIEIGYDRMDLSAILNGDHNFKLQTAVKFARYFNVPVFMLFSRVFDDHEYRSKFQFAETDYMEVIRENFRVVSAKQAQVRMDSTTVSHIMNNRRNNLTINTLCKIAAGAEVPLSQLLKTEQDKETEERLKKEKENDE